MKLRLVVLLATGACGAPSSDSARSQAEIPADAYVAAAGFIEARMDEFLNPGLGELRVLPTVGPFDLDDDAPQLDAGVSDALLAAGRDVGPYEYTPDARHLQFVKAESRSAELLLVEAVSLHASAEYLEDVWWALLVRCAEASCQVVGGIPRFGFSEIEHEEELPERDGLDQARFDSLVQAGCAAASSAAVGDPALYWHDSRVPGVCGWNGEGE